MTTRRVRVDGKQLAVGPKRFRFRGVSYGTFRPRESDGARFPERAVVARDLDAMSAAGITVVRTYTAPPADVLDAVAAREMHLLAGVFFRDWRYLVGASSRDTRAVARAARAAVADAARALRDREEVAALVLANEVPADVVRWVGTDVVERVLGELVDVAKSIAPDLLVTYGGYPTTEYLAVRDLDFELHNVFLERRDDLRRYLAHLHQVTSDRPIVLGEIGYDTGSTAQGERRQAELLDWTLETAIECGLAGTCVFSWTDDWWVGDEAVSDWHFGITRADRSPRPALDVVRRWAERDVRDLRGAWPPMSVVVCAHDEAATIGQCVRELRALDYPQLEIIVVDDGSSDDTAGIARAAGGPAVRVVRTAHGGLSVARNEGARVATHDLVAYLDADAYPSPEWPYYLALAFNADDIAAAGGPNLAPPPVSRSVATIAAAPGSPVPVLIGDDRAEHLPGCNLALRRDALADVGGFDARYRTAGDDVDLCWRLADRGWQLAYHPAAFVWHHRRATTRAYLRQQRGYGRAEALVEVEHPDRFTATGAARWRGRMYAATPRRDGRRRIHRGRYGSAAFQTAHAGDDTVRELVRQVGVPLAVAASPSALLGIVDVRWSAPGLVALVVVVAWAAREGIRAPRGASRTHFAVLAVAQPIARAFGRGRGNLGREVAVPGRLPPLAELSDAGGGVLITPHDRERPQLVVAALRALRHAGLWLRPASAWADHDASGRASLLVRAELVTSAHPPRWVQLRLRKRLATPHALAVVGVATFAIARHERVGAAIVLALAAADVAVGALRSGPMATRALRRVGAPSGAAVPAPLDAALMTTDVDVVA